MGCNTSSQECPFNVSMIYDMHIRQLHLILCSIDTAFYKHSEYSNTEVKFKSA